jgi:hypothetical protein
MLIRRLGADACLSARHSQAALRQRKANPEFRSAKWSGLGVFPLPSTAWMRRFAMFILIYRFSSNAPFFELDYPLSGAIDSGISHSLYNQAQKR